MRIIINQRNLLSHSMLFFFNVLTITRLFSMIYSHLFTSKHSLKTWRIQRPSLLKACHFHTSQKRSKITILSPSSKLLLLKNLFVFSSLPSTLIKRNKRSFNPLFLLFQSINNPIFRPFQRQCRYTNTAMTLQLLVLNRIK